MLFQGVLLEFASETNKSLFLITTNASITLFSSAVVQRERTGIYVHVPICSFFWYVNQLPFISAS